MDGFYINICQSNKLLHTESTSTRDVYESVPENMEISIFSKYCDYIYQHGATSFGEKHDEIKTENKTLHIDNV